MVNTISGFTVSRLHCNKSNLVLVPYMDSQHIKLCTLIIQTDRPLLLWVAPHDLEDDSKRPREQINKITAICSYEKQVQSNFYSFEILATQSKRRCGIHEENMVGKTCQEWLTYQNGSKRTSMANRRRKQKMKERHFNQALLR